jgi:dihydrofolate reductase
MSNVVFDISMSLDGYVTAAGQTAEEPLGTGGERLHSWLSSPEGQRLLEKEGARLGVVICGRKTYDDSLPWWQADGPTGSLRLPVIVVTHRPAGPHGVYRFATDVHDALAQAREIAGDRTVTVMGGASIGRQFLAAGLVDEVSLHVAPVVLGGGTRLFDEPLELRPTEVVNSAEALHLRFSAVSAGLTSRSGERGAAAGRA